ncbi:MAG: hypothetical protein JO252_00900 [Planctomycetaceae bacterium]|nr:hypothetical protein [Planctomycetaceae bacterium]
MSLRPPYLGSISVTTGLRPGARSTNASPPVSSARRASRADRGPRPSSPTSASPIRVPLVAPLGLRNPLQYLQAIASRTGLAPSTATRCQ